ncbi:hypothetical protein M0R45_005983 [Rubus argutus]|uniref:3'-5' exonuclease domain-containing protein n=1 Tax=Rubus argutus TaxID=59490 RepID=A0AAW1YP59_RUBAR
MSTEIVVKGNPPVSVMVTKRNKEVDDSIEKFLSNLNAAKVIGLDIEWSLIRESDGVTRSKIALLTLCDGTHCLIVQLPHLDSVPKSLFNFLHLPDYTFVGFDIVKNMDKLEKEYGFGCKNYVDLRTMAAKCDYSPFWGSARMTERFCCAGVIDKPKSAVFDDWGNINLNEDQVNHATLNVFAYRQIGFFLS